MADTFKFSTLLWLVAAALIPLWPLTLPVCLYMAYRSYKGGSAKVGTLSDLQTAVELNKAGHLSDEALERIKYKTFGAPSLSDPGRLKAETINLQPDP